MPDYSDPNRIELRSQEVGDILGRVPGWVTRNGTLLFTLVIGLLILGAWFFRYPDVRKATVVITSVNPPVSLEARTSGKIIALLVTDNQVVREGEVLAVLENPADFVSMIDLKYQLKAMAENPDTLFSLSSFEHSALGPVQPFYAAYRKSYRDLLAFIDLDYHNQKITSVRNEVQKQKNYTGSLEIQRSTLNEEYQLARRQFLRDSALFQQKVVSASVLETSRSTMLNSKNNLQEVLTRKAENDITLSRLEAQVQELELKKQEELERLKILTEESLNRLKASLGEWEQTYMLVSPVKGTISFNSYWSENQNVRQGETVMTVVPDEAGTIIGKVKLPVRGAGEVHEGQQVNIRFENYPYLKYGMVEGVVQNVSKVPDDNNYTVEISLPEGLKTFYGIDIAFSQNMQGEAEIMTDNMRLLQRIFNPVRNMVARQQRIKS
ncbi:MAG: HlyD family secretion protein [Bacteroidota bacterium]